MIRSKLRPRFLATMILALTLIGGFYSFEASASATVGGAHGLGGEVISGFDVSNISYQANLDRDPGTIDSVTFDLVAPGGAGPAAEVYVKLVSDSADWFPCSAANGAGWSCSISGVPTAAVDELSVVATQ